MIGKTLQKYRIVSGEMDITIYSASPQGAAKQAVDCWWTTQRLGLMLMVLGGEEPVYFDTRALQREGRI